MKKKALWRDIKLSFFKSKGRFISIICLMMLGSFALVGLKVTGPDMRITGQHYFDKYNAADLTVISDYGLSKGDQEQINKAQNLKDIEYGYLKDMIIKNSRTSFRVFSAPDKISNYEVIDGRYPKNSSEIAVSAAYQKKYPIGSTIEFDEKEDLAGNKVLTNHKFKVVGHINSVEILSSINLGASSAGSGELKGYAIVTPSTFDSEVFMIARATFNDTNIDPYSKEYTNRIFKHKKNIEELLADRPKARFLEIESESKDKINEGELKIAQAIKKISDNEKKLKEAKQQISDGKGEINDKQQELSDKIASAEQQLSDGADKIASGKKSLADAAKELADGKLKLDTGSGTLASKALLIDDAKTKLANVRQNLDDASAQLATAKTELSGAKDTITAAYDQIATKQAAVNLAKQQLADKQTAVDTLTTNVNDLNTAQTDAQIAAAPFNQDVKSAQATVDTLNNQISTLSSDAESKKATLASAVQTANAQVTSCQTSLTNPALTPEEKASFEAQLLTAQTQVATAQANLDAYVSGDYAVVQTQIADLQSQLQTAQTTLSQAQTAAQPYNQAVTDATTKLEAAKTNLTNAQTELTTAETQIADSQSEIDTAKTSVDTQAATLADKQALYDTQLANYQAGEATYQTKLAEFDKALEDYKTGLSTLDEKSLEYKNGLSRYQSGKDLIAQKEKDLASGKEKLATSKADGEQKLSDARSKLEDAQEKYDLKAKEFKAKKKKGFEIINEKKSKLADSKEKLNTLSLPEYTVSTRREIHGAEGYKIYTTVSNVVDSLANIFPVFLYFVAALVTSTTMTRFVDEERINSGTLKALGYNNKDVMKKFVSYGFVASIIGAIIGTIMGHLLMPWIVYNAYQHSYTVPPIEIHFHWGVTLLAILLALLSAVVPAIIVVQRELMDCPAKLLLPKPPVNGSKILLERMTPIWNRMSFTHKVTARNIFRYKKRMAMTIFGVCGGVTLLFAGLGVQHSISGINDRQFGDIIRYDLIVATKDKMTQEEQDSVNQQLKDERISMKTDVHFEEVYKVAGKNNDDQPIKIIVPNKETDFSDFISLNNRKSQKALPFSQDGAIITERLADLLNVKVGDQIEVRDADNINHKIKISGIAEMYMGHSIYMNDEVYRKEFKKAPALNGHLLILKEKTEDNTREVATDFMNVEGIKGVVQNISITNQIDTIVHSLNKIMRVLVIVAVFLSIVILYNLTNINVSERIRELSTIKVLGFHNKEVTMYIYRETIVLSILGILVGYGLGKWLHYYIIHAVAPEDSMFNPIIGSFAFIAPAIVTITITVILGFFVNKRLRNVNMLEALKSVD